MESGAFLRREGPLIRVWGALGGVSASSFALGNPDVDGAVAQGQIAEATLAFLTQLKGR